jgi:aminoglycoside phosphotransferase (APT) family kinase protein
VLLRDLHRATSTFRPPPDAVWRPWYGRSLPATVPVVGHGDTTPWNVLARDGAPVAFVDWETAGPFDAIWELAHTCWLNAQLYDDDVAALDGLPDAATRARRLALLVDGYGLPRPDRGALVDRMVELAVISAREDAVEAGVTRENGGSPLVWGVVWRTRSGAWMVRNRPLLLRALGATGP